MTARSRRRGRILLALWLVPTAALVVAGFFEPVCFAFAFVLGVYIPFMVRLEANKERDRFPIRGTALLRRRVRRMDDQ